MPEFGTFKDERDGYVYKTVKIGNQVWFAENFRYECAGSKVHDNKKKNLNKYGRLYTWHSAVNAAPEGWRLPSNEDWDILMNQVGGRDVAGTVLKSRTGWSGTGNGTDKYGFKAQPGGFGYSDSVFSLIRDCGYWWTTCSSEGHYAQYKYLHYHYNEVYWHTKHKSVLHSVRYVRD